ncbi:hypothetical protein J2Z84_003365 [Agrobacterium rubi]|nr:hypothetical protein [Agrobacterium rubi]
MLHPFSLHRLLRHSVPTRLLIVTVVLVPLWLAIAWAVRLS